MPEEKEKKASGEQTKVEKASEKQESPNTDQRQKQKGELAHGDGEVVLVARQLENGRYAMDLADGFTGEGDSLAECLSNILHMLKRDFLNNDEVQISDKQAMNIKISDLLFGKLTFKE